MADFVYKSNRPGYDLTTFMNPEISAGEFLGNLHDKNRLDVYINYNLFSFAFQAFKGMNSVELNLKSSTNVTLPYELFEFMKETAPMSSTASTTSASAHRITLNLLSVTPTRSPIA